MHPSKSAERTSLGRLVRFFVIACFILFGVPILGLSFNGAASDLPSMLGGSKAYAPSLAAPGMLLGAVFFGLVAGLITGAIGAGGGYIITPALMSFGIRGIMAVGTDQFHIFANSLIGTFTHRRQGNVNLGLAVWFAVGSVFGVTAGARVNRLLYNYSPSASDAVISSVYVIVFAILAAYCMSDWVTSRRCKEEQVTDTEPLTSLANRLQALPFKPRVRFDEHLVPGGRSISVYPVVLCGAIVGFAAALMGIGGGLLTFPLLVYGLGVSTCTTVGTSVLQILVTTAYSSVVQYGIYGFVFYTLAVAMLVGSLFGVHIGTLVTAMVPSSQIRFLYALTVLAGLVNRACALPAKLADLGYLRIDSHAAFLIEKVGTWLFFGLVGVFGIWIIAVFAAGARQSRKEVIRSGWAASTRKLALGLGGVLACLLFLVLSSVPLSGGTSALTKVDRFFNQLAKHSANFHEQAINQARRYRGKSIDVSIRPDFPSAKLDWARSEKGLLTILEANGIDVEIAGGGWFRIRGDYGRLTTAAIADAKLAFYNDEPSLEHKYSIPSREVIFTWWQVFSRLEIDLASRGQAEEASFAQYVQAKVLEPAYNFSGIQARAISQNLLPAVLLLAFYLVFTLLYGFSTFMLLDGLGIASVCRNG